MIWKQTTKLKFSCHMVYCNIVSSLVGGNMYISINGEIISFIVNQTQFHFDLHVMTSVAMPPVIIVVAISE